MLEANAHDRIARLRREHPRLYAARHLAKPVGQVLIAVIAIGAYFLVPLPGIDLPSISLPDLPEIPGWLGTVLWWGKFAVILVVAVLLVLAEIDKHRPSHRTEGHGGD